METPVDVNGASGRPAYTLLATGALGFAVVTFIIAALHHPTDRLADTGSPVVPGQGFFWLQAVVYVALGYYVYRLWTWVHDCHILFLRFPLAVTLIAQGLGWIFWCRGNMVLAAISLGVATLWISAALVWYHLKREQFHKSEMEPLEHTTPYKPPVKEVYWATIAPTATFTGYLWVLFYLVLVGALNDAGQIGSPRSAANILATFIVPIVTISMITFQDVHIASTWWLSLIFIARGLEWAPDNLILVANVWLSTGILAGLLFWSLPMRFMYFSKKYITPFYQSSSV